MKHRQHPGGLTPPTTAFLLLALAVSVGRAAETNTPPSVTGSQIIHSVEEKAYDGKFTISTDTRKVDANSDIIVSFQTLTNVAPADPSPEWVRLTNVLASVERAFAERATLRERLKNINLANTNAVNELKSLNREFSLKVVKLRDEWQETLGLKNDDVAFDRILSGEFDGEGTALQPYFNLSRWIRKELERLNQNAIRLVNANSTLVTVQAFHSPIGGARRAIHVEGYDNIPAGELQPIDRTGLRLTPAEQARLAMEVEMAESAAQAIREIQEKGGDIKASFTNLFAQVRARLSEIENDLRNNLLKWDAAVEEGGVPGALQTLAQDGALPAEVRDAASAIATNLAAFRKEIDLARSTILRIQDLKAQLTSGGNRGLSQLLFDSGGLFDQVKSVITSVRTLVQTVANWPARLQQMGDALTRLGDRLTPVQKVALLPPELNNFVQQVQQQFPKTLEAISTVVDFMKGNADPLQGAETLAGTDIEPIWRDQFDLVNGVIELPRVGLAQGDEMMIKVRSREKGTNDVPGKTVSDESYKVQTVLMGFHREFGASVIFARGLRGAATEREWKPNVAAHVHWFYRYREERNGWRKCWNAVNPGLGLHLASLDQGDDAVEFGTGLNVSFFDGLITGGGGFNLNNHEHPYVFVGLSLLDMLEKAKKLKR